jgi:outer membrane protein insertion porin family
MKLLLLALAVCAPGFSQTGAKKAAPPAPAAAPSKWPVQSIAVEGNRVYTRDQILGIAGIKSGQMASKAEFEAARNKLLATGAFTEVAYKYAAAPDGRGYTATFTIVEYETIYPVVFEDLHVSTLELAATLGAKDPLFSMEKLPATQPVLERHARWIEEFVKAKGLPEEKIAGTVKPSPEGGYMIVFRPTRPLPAVAQVTFEGNEVVPQNVLREAVAGAAVGSPYTEDSFRQVLNASVRPVYEQRGRIKVAFPKIRTEPVSDVNGVHVFVTVDEGQVYELGKVAIEGPAPLPAETLLKAGDFKTGDVANMEKVTEGLERMVKAAKRAGYLNARVTSERRPDNEAHKVDIGVRIDAGPQYTMGKLNLVGLDLEGEAAMKKMWGMKEGKPFNPDYPDSFLKRVHEEGLFDNLGQTKSEVKLDAKAHVADVTLRFSGEDAQRKPGRRGGRGPGADY